MATRAPYSPPAIVVASVAAYSPMAEHASRVPLNGIDAIYGAGRLKTPQELLIVTRGRGTSKRQIEDPSIA